MSLLWFITSIVVAANFYAGYRFGTWRTKRAALRAQQPINSESTS